MHPASLVAGILIVLQVLMMLVWTSLANFRWEREVADVASGDSFGKCRGDGLSTSIFDGSNRHRPACCDFRHFRKAKSLAGDFSEARWMRAQFCVSVELCLWEGLRSPPAKI